MNKHLKLLSVCVLLSVLLCSGSYLGTASVSRMQQRQTGIKPDARLKVHSATISKSDNRKLNLKAEDVFPGVIRVKLTEATADKVSKKTGKSTGIQRSSATKRLNVGVAALNNSLEIVKASEMKRVFPYNVRYEVRQRAEGLHLWYEVKIDPEMLSIAACEEMIKCGDVELVEPVLRLELKDNVGGKEKEKAKSTIKGVKAENVSKEKQLLPFIMPEPNSSVMKRMLQNKASIVPFAASARNYEENPPTDDPYLLTQWHYYNYGQIEDQTMGKSTPGADIALFDAWKITMGSPDVIVAIHDQGIEAIHPDLADNMWVNEAELNGKPGVDDDGNGYIDDINGYNFWEFSGVPIQVGSHGTHVAGTVGAVNNNGIGVGGVAGGSGKRDGVKMISCQVLGDGVTAKPNVGASYVYAANMGAVISQNSWGYSSPNYYEQSVLDGIDYFIKYAGKDENGQPLPNTRMVGGIVIVAGGNVAENAAYYPQYYEPCMAVGATGPWNNRTWYTNWGNWIDISAPGGDNGVPTPYAGVVSCAPGGGYGYMSGTSMACPHVSGVAALILTKFGGRAYTPEMLRQRLYQGATLWSEINPEYTGILGVGLLNAARSLTLDTGVAPDSIGDLQVKNCGFDFVRVVFTAPKDADNKDAQSYEIRYSKEPLTAANIGKSEMMFQLANRAGYKEEVIIDRLKGSTNYYITVRSMDVYGNLSTLSNVVMATTGTIPGLICTPDSLSVKIIDAKSNPFGETTLMVGNTQGGDLRYSMKYIMREIPGSDPYIFPYTFTKVNNLHIPFTGKIGETDNVNFGTFVAASRFDVEGVDEFNLTHFTAGILSETWYKGRPDYMGKPFVVRIVRGGGNPAQGKVEFDEDYVVPGKAWLLAWGQDLTFDLEDNILFKKGEHFWIVFDFPSGYLYPMLINDKTTRKDNYDLWSVDGKEWSDINKIPITDLEPSFAYRVHAHSILENLPMDIISFDPVTGLVPAGTKSAVKVKVNASKIRDGHYNSVLVLTSNDSKHAVTKIPFAFDVDGHLWGIWTPKRLDIGGTVQGFTNSVDIFVHNDALGIVRIDTIFADAGKDKFFSVKPNRNLQIEKGDSVKLTVTFRAPQATTDGTVVADSIGVFISKLNFRHSGSVFHTMPMEANAIERPIAVLDRTSDTIEIKMGEKKTVTFTLKNEGKYRLDYAIGSDETTDYDFHEARPWMKTYFGKAELGREFTYIRYSNKGEKNITDDIKKAGVQAYALPFSVNYYGVNYDSISIADAGCISFGRHEKGDPINISLGHPQRSFPASLVPVYFGGSDPMVVNNRPSSQVWLKMEDDKVIIEYIDAGARKHFGAIDVQTIIYADGRIDYCYRNYRKAPEGNYGTQIALVTQIGMTDTDGMAGMVVWHRRYPTRADQEGWIISTHGELDGFFEGTYYTYPDGVRRDTLWETSFIQRPFIRYKRPNWGADPNADNYNLNVPDADGRTIRKGFDSESVIIHITPEMQKAKDITPSSGSLFPGESQEITMTFQIDKNVKEEMLLARIPIVTNDPLNKDMNFSVYLDYKSEALPVLSTLEMDFGKLGKDVSEEQHVLMENKGGKLFKAKAKMQNGEVFRVDNVTERICNGLSILKYNITFMPTAEKLYEDVLVIETDIEGQAPLTMRVKGRGTKRPVQQLIAVTPMEFEVALRSQDLYRDSSFILKNIGDSVLLYNMKANFDWIKYMDGNDMVSMFKDGYFWQNQQRLEPGKEVVIRFRLDAAKAPDNLAPYMGKLVVMTNDPKNPKDSAQFKLTVYGETGAQIKIGGEDTRTINLGEALRSYYPVSHQTWGDQGAMSYNMTESVVYSDTISVTNTGTRRVILKKIDGYTDIPGDPQPVRLNMIDLSTKNPAGFLLVDAGKTQNYKLSLNPASDPYFAAKTGLYTVKYALTDACDKQYGEKCKDLFGYTQTRDVTEMVWNPDSIKYLPVVRKEYYKSDTLLVTFNLKDVPKEEITSTKKAHEFIMESRDNKSNSFSVSVINEPMRDTFWKDMHQTINYFSLVTDQANLTYEVAIEELMSEEYKTLLNPKAKSMRLATSSYPQTSMAVDLKRTAFVASGSTDTHKMQTRAAATTFADSLEYHDYSMLYDGFFPNAAEERLTAGIRYKTGATGFNLTHLTCWVGMMKNDVRQGFDLEVEVWLGRDFGTAERIYAEIITPSALIERQFAFNMLSLKEAVYVYPNQYFWIAIRSRVNTAIASTLYEDGYFLSRGYKPYFWFDNEHIAGITYNILGGALGWAINAYSAEKREVPENWIQVDKTKGSVAVGASDAFNVTVNPGKDVNNKPGRYAKISVKSNDTYPFDKDATLRSGLLFMNAGDGSSKVKFDDFIRDRGYILVKMEVNRAPEFVKNRDNYYMVEAQDTILPIRVSDFDGDKITLTYQLDSAVFAEPKFGVAPEITLSEGVVTDSTVNFRFKMKTGYESTGMYYYTLKANDGKGHEDTHSIRIGVSNVNRAPELVSNTTFVIAKEQSKMINLNTLFSDPDRDQMQFVTESSDIDVVAVTVVDSMLSLFGWAESTAKVRVMAIDPQNATAVATLDITVVKDDQTLKSQSVSIYPNPVVDVVNCDFSLAQRSDVEVRIFGTDGRMFYRSEKIGYVEGKHHTTINVSNLPGGIYILQYLINGQAVDTQKFVK